MVDLKKSLFKLLLLLEKTPSVTMVALEYSDAPVGGETLIEILMETQ